jgi:ankyrin repeat protein
VNNTASLFEAIQARNLGEVKALLTAEPGLIDARSGEGTKPLLAAIYAGAADIVQELLVRGAPISVFDAAALGDTERVAALTGQDPSLVHAFSDDGWTALHLAAYFGHQDTAALLLEQGAAVNVYSRNWLRNLPLHAALAGRGRHFAALLVAGGSDVNAKQHGDDTPLHETAYNGDVENARLLLANGARINERNGKGKTALGIALEKGHTTYVKCLEELGGIA